MYSKPSEKEIKAIRGSGKIYSCVDEIYIKATAEEIYQTLIDFNHRHLWWPNNSAEIEGAEELVQVDSIVNITSGKGLSKVSFRARILHLDPPWRVVCHFFDGAITGVVEWEVVEKNDSKGCLLKLHWGNIKPKNFLAKIIFKLMGTRLHQIRSASGMKGLKRYLEEKQLSAKDKRQKVDG